MGDIQELQTMLAELDDQLVVCMRCGMCQSVCPVFGETLREGDVTRGKLALLDSLGNHLISDAAGVKERLDKCLLCGSCESSCPSGVKVTDIFIKARVILTTYLGLSPVKRAIFRGALSRPALFSSLLSMAGTFQGVMTTSANAFFDTTCSKVMSKYIGDRHIIPLAESPFRKQVPSQNTSPGSSGLKVAFYPGCVVDKIYPEIGAATLKVLDHHGVGVFMPEKQGCCGIPALASGDKKTFEKLLIHNLKRFEEEDFDVLVTPCGTCTSTIKKFWPAHSDALPEDIREKARVIAEKTMDISEFLVDRLNVDLSGGVDQNTETSDAGESVRVTWHDPCHLKKSLGVAAQPRSILKNTPGLELVEMNGADTCCGNGGSFNIQHYDTSRDIGTKKQESIAATGADIVATGCPACMLQMTDMLSQSEHQIKVQHVIELYANSL